MRFSSTGVDGSWKDVLAIEADKIPTDETPIEPAREWDYRLPEAAPGRFVRLFFPDGDQPQAKYEGYICLGEVQIDAPGLALHMTRTHARSPLMQGVHLAAVKSWGL
jgi:hypothetical protein